MRGAAPLRYERSGLGLRVLPHLQEISSPARAGLPVVRFEEGVLVERVCPLPLGLLG
jgi:hypothetical protein